MLAAEEIDKTFPELISVYNKHLNEIMSRGIPEGSSAAEARILTIAKLNTNMDLFALEVLRTIRLDLKKIQLEIETLKEQKGD